MNDCLKRLMALTTLGRLALGGQALRGSGYNAFLFGVAYYPEQWEESDGSRMLGGCASAASTRSAWASSRGRS